MLSHDSLNFLNKVLDHIQFFGDRNLVKEELRDHLEDRIEDLLEEGYVLEEAEKIAIRQMGDPDEIGQSLKQVHHPLIGWLHVFTNIMVALIGIYTLYIVLAMTYNSVTDYMAPLKFISKDQIIYQQSVDENFQLEDKNISVTDLVYRNDGKLYLVYKYTSPRVFRRYWGLNDLGDISDENGQVYFAYHNHGSHGYLAYGVLVVPDFPLEAKKIEGNYDRYNRRFGFSIDIEYEAEDE